jgi:hypothetical protein
MFGGQYQIIAYNGELEEPEQRSNMRGSRKGVTMELIYELIELQLICNLRRLCVVFLNGTDSDSGKRGKYVTILGLSADVLRHCLPSISCKSWPGRPCPLIPCALLRSWTVSHHADRARENVQHGGNNTSSVCNMPELGEVDTYPRKATSE